MKPCTVLNCNRPHYAKGLCAMHYQRLTATGTTDKKHYPLICSVNGCNKKRKSKGLCVAHYTRVIRTGSLDSKVVVNDNKKRLLSNAAANDNGCLEWSKFLKNGYGVTILNGKLEQAHRAAWMVFKGDIPTGMQVNHKCHNKACINVDHLYVGTQKQNMSDMKNANRENRAKGCNNGNSKLNATKVLEIRNHQGSRKELADRFGVSLSTISAVKTFKVWKHL